MLISLTVDLESPTLTGSLLIVVDDPPPLVGTAVVGPSDNVGSLLDLALLDIEDEVVAVQFDGAVLVELPLLVVASVSRVLDDVGTLVDTTLNVNDLVGVGRHDVSVVVDVELLVISAGVAPDYKFGAVVLRGSVDVQDEVGVGFRNDPKAARHCVCLFCCWC